MNLYNIERAVQTMKARGWDKIFWAIDLHDTICPADYINPYTDFYPDAKEVLQHLSLRPDVGLILFTSSFNPEVAQVVSWLGKHEIFFDYVNENPECENTRLGNFETKFYFNVLLDDKAGFEGATDWTLIKQKLQEMGAW